MALTALSSGKIYKYEYGTDEEILPSNQTRTIEKAMFSYSPLKKAIEKQTKKQVDALKSLIKLMNSSKGRIYFPKIKWMIWVLMR